MSRSVRVGLIAAATALLAVLGAASASAGIIDGSLNDPHVADASKILDPMVGSQLTDNPNNNANTRTDGDQNNSD